MSTNELITAQTADQLISRLDSVANLLRAMRDIATYAETPQAMSAACVMVGGLCERSHLNIDGCMRRLGDPGLGNFNDNDWNDSASASQ